MAVLNATLRLNYDGRQLPTLQQSLAVSNDQGASFYRLTSNQSNVLLPFGSVTNANAVYLACDASMTFALNSGTTYTLSTNGAVFLLKASGVTTVTVTNNQSTGTLFVTYGIYGAS